LFVSEAAPRISLLKAVRPAFTNLYVGTNYQLETSRNLVNWSNSGPIFVATNTSVVYPQYFNVDAWNELFFRVQPVP
jgi:hypothetical protein